MGTVAALWRYPVKSMLGEAVRTVRVGDRGVSGDRAFAVVDERGAIGSAKHPRKWGPLLHCRSRLTETGGARVELPDGTTLDARDGELATRLSDLLGRPVTVSDLPPEQGAPLERAVPAYEGGVPEAQRERAVVDETGERITSGGVAPGTFLDFGAVHLVTTSALARTRALHPAGDADARRFRPNLVVDLPGGPGFPEDAWPGREVRVGTALLRITLPTPRCVVPTLAHGELPADPALMRAVARAHRIPVPDLGRLSCLGVYLDVVEPGEVTVGDPVELRPAR